MPQAPRDRLQRGRPRNRGAAEEAAETSQVFLVLELEELKEPFRRHEPVEVFVGVDNGHSTAAAKGRRTCGCLEFGLRRNEHGLLRDLSERRLLGRGEQALDRNDPREALFLEQNDFRGAREPPSHECRPYLAGAGGRVGQRYVGDGGLAGGALEDLHAPNSLDHVCTLAGQADAVGFGDLVRPRSSLGRQNGARAGSPIALCL